MSFYVIRKSEFKFKVGVKRLDMTLRPDADVDGTLSSIFV